MNDRRKIYEGKAKILFEGPERHTLVQHFKDDATAFNAQKSGTISGKGVLNNRMSAYIMERLNAIGIPTHFIKALNMREQLIKRLDIIPIEVVVRNVAAGSLCKRLAIKEGHVLARPLIELYYKSDALNDPLINEDHVLAFSWADSQELEDMMTLALRVNDFLSGMMAGAQLTLVDIKLEFGRTQDDNQDIVLADEISPDGCRLWDSTTHEKMDKDRFRYDLGNVADAYQEVAKRLGILPLTHSRTTTAIKGAAKKPAAKPHRKKRQP
ncbi:MAG: phosphoribosylaminoimidazolesuccinocarboxamide synthase [Alphaproteobacteria bacterium GM202ARS2]|nr:phosphoribosylaminoimidazolesuccinocarboxamide synthase [Alphaproteobacteria bacterium GM202ARS2]